ncbi:MAG: Carbamoyl-phosphate synthase large chain [Alphaproteobacteria bacterium MarineAlpha6_Bin6]|nr:MAG: Carbamoyl-phosphate synthase large chain [Alphaproteobacteria bacterium MarineAlpha6_Bin6]PPR33489.1 MAG: Carbamoyl-phosphate synthase large chain [Alphaproteobacteria bacterium MarineAlpha6_Bin5]|tara:strand:+ start:5669 stop:8914 length:3246 start_codon:yes stop_codon:yes gene_type:complete
MPKRKDLKSIFIIGAGPIIIGQACEFDYSGTQACKALREEGYKVILLNSNPATIMTDPDIADSTYIEPITSEIIEKIIKKEKPDAILPTMGGQTALNAVLEIEKNNILKKNKIELIGASLNAIKKAENRELFKKTMAKLGLRTPKSFVVKNLKSAKKILKKLPLPLIIRPSFTLGGLGGGTAKNIKEFEKIITQGLEYSPIKEVLIEESVLGWKEYELEVVRDKNDNCIVICSIENIDPMGVHTGDSITVAPALTLTDKEYQIMRNASFAILREIGVDTGGSNVQFAVNPKNGEMVVIEMNPRVSRSSALASKATGFPIAKIAAKLAVGLTLDEIKNDITKTTPASFEPTIDYIVTKIPRFAFEKFPGTKNILGTSMKSVGEVMAIGRNFCESFQKAVRSLDKGYDGLTIEKNKIKTNISNPSPLRFFQIAEELRKGNNVNNIYKKTKIDKWFLREIKRIIDYEKIIKKKGISKNKNEILKIKSLGFSDKRLAFLTNKKEKDIKNLRNKFNVKPVYKRVDTCAAEFSSLTPYMYSTYEKSPKNIDNCEAKPTKKNKVIIIGGGPNRIGQGIEFDYCCVHASYALRKKNIETIMINCNPETVSTDYDTSDRLYFEPLTPEDVIEIIKIEKSNGKLLGLILQFGGQTPLNLAKHLVKEKIKILGTSLDSIDIAEDRKRFKKIIKDIKIKQPDNATAKNFIEAKNCLKKIGLPLIIRPSYVLGGKAMEIINDKKEFFKYTEKALKITKKSPLLIDSYLKSAVEIDVDAISDGKKVYIAGIMEHIEEAGIHSGDSACVIPPYTLKKSVIKEIESQTTKLAIKLKVKGLINIQFAVQNDDIYIIEANPRASRTVPFVAKSTGIPIAKIAALIMTGEKLERFKLEKKQFNHIAVKESVFPFSKFDGSDVILGPEMKSTGEAMGMDFNFGKAFAKSQLSAGVNLPLNGNLFVSVKNSDKEFVYENVKNLKKIGFKIFATRGTANFLKSKKIDCVLIKKVKEGSPNIVNYINNRKINLIFNTTEGSQAIKDSFTLRRAAISNKIPYYTTMAGAKASVEAIKELSKKNLQISSLQKYFFKTKINKVIKNV